jgi:hypothetical protein
MLSIFSCKNQDRTVPDWANTFSKKEYNHFINLVENYFKKKGLKIKIEDGVIIAEENELGLNNLGLVNIAQTCKQLDQNDWPASINDHFESLINSFKIRSEFKSIENDFEKIRKYLGVKVYHVDFLNTVGKENTIYKPITDDMVEVLVYDLPTSVESIEVKNLKIWNKQAEELFAQGLINTDSTYQNSISQETLGDIKIWFIQADHIFTANIILEPEKLSKYIGTHGALIGIPHRHSVLIYPIESLEVTKAINTLIPIINGMNLEGPGSISGKLFWYSDNKLLDLPYSLENQKIEFYPPDNFVTMLNALKK